jgi:hypothetical protein
MRRSFTLLAAVGLCVLAACSTTTEHASAPSVPLTPTETVLAWFHAMNAQDGAATQAYLASSARYPSDAAGTIPRNGFRKVHCRPLGRTTRTKATVYCSFTEAPGTWMGNPDTWWTVALRNSGGRWLITNHGQG